jgi:hypothetical protein
MCRDRAGQKLPMMLFLLLLRRTAARMVLDAIGRRILFDAVPTTHRRSRLQHLRNGVGTLMLTSSRFVWRPSLTVSLYYMTRTVVRSELRYGLREVGHALALPDEAPKRQTLALAAAPGILAGVALVERARRRTGEPPELPVRATPPAPAPVGS